MKIHKIKQIYIYILLLICFVGIFLFFFLQKKFMNKNSNSNTSIIDMEINTDDGDEKIDWSKYENTSYTLSESITITNEGVYNLTGTIQDGLITVDTSGNVKLIFDNVNIINTKGPAILIKNVSDVVIELSAGSTNTLEDGSSYSGYEEEVGVIFSHDDLTFDGEGTLVVKSNKEDGIVSTDDLKIKNGIYEITTIDDGIRGKDSVYIQNGTFKITSGGDAIKSTNTTDSEKGFVLLENGQFILNATLDGIQAETKLYIKNGNFDITTGGGSTNASTDTRWGFWGTNKTSINSDSAKGLKAAGNIVIENGSFVISSSDDAIHSNNYVGIKAGNFNLASLDDGVHADEELIIDGGNIQITKSYEGLEASKITINDGDIYITSLDDGINVAGGNDSSSMNRPGANQFSKNSSTNNILTIHGGTIYVDAEGDGLDSNGSIYINGGTIKIDGPTNSGNGALDYDQECVVTGGVLLAGGASGMAEGISQNSSVYSLFINFSTNYKSGDKITIVDSNKKEILSYESSKTFSSLVVASCDFKKGSTYTIQVNGVDYETVTISSITTNVGNTNGGMKGGTGKQPGRGGPR